MVAMKRMWLAIVLCLVSLSGTALAQGDLTLADLEIALWPEFDRPGVLVIYRGQFEPTTTLPQSVEVRIPAEVGAPTAVAYVGEDDGRYNLQYTTRVESDETIVAFDLPTLGFQLEYYDTLPIDPSGERAYEFAYTANYPVRDLALEVQVPPAAGGFELNPEADAVEAGSGGLLYQRLDAGPLARGETFELGFRYSKEGDELTSSGSQQSSTSGNPSTAMGETGGGDGGSTVALFVVAFVALLAVGVGAYWLGQRTQSPAPQAPVRRAQRRGGGGGGGRQEIYCHKCGTGLRPDSEFCHLCGAKVRSE
jgi:hypothetical protein